MTDQELLDHCKEQCVDGMPWVKAKHIVRMQEILGKKCNFEANEEYCRMFRMDLVNLCNKVAKRINPK